jgi:uncharacterized protein YdeI (YjbR/CyaY-like superfamily)
MKTYQNIHFKNRESFRSWLNINFEKSHGIWMIFFKKHTKKENITYDEAVEEALCFGWIDSTIKRIDEERYVQKFTPRTNIKNWSDPNKIRVLHLIKNGQITQAGLNKIDLYLKTGKVDWKVEPKIKSQKKPLIVPKFIEKHFSNHQPAWDHFKALAPSHQRNFIRWIADAKREETRMKRLNESVDLLKENKKIGMK